MLRYSVVGVLVVGAVLTVLGGIGWWLFHDEPSHPVPWGLGIAGLMLLIVAATDSLLEPLVARRDQQAASTGGSPASDPTQSAVPMAQAAQRIAEIPREATLPPEVTDSAAAIAPYLGVAPLMLVGFSMVRASVGPFAYAPSLDHPRMPLLLIFGAVIPFAALGLGLLLDRQTPEKPKRPYLLVVLFIGLVGGVTFIGIAIEDGLWRITEAISTTGVVIAFFIALTLVGAGLFFVAEAVNAPLILRVFRVDRIPIFILLLVWALLRPSWRTAVTTTSGSSAKRGRARDPGSCWETHSMTG